jgi:hypothetical protein
MDPHYGRLTYPQMKIRSITLHEKSQQVIYLQHRPDTFLTDEVGETSRDRRVVFVNSRVAVNPPAPWPC